eukprot:2174240-Lingulodinium_polyedra.AAC.1
MSPGCPGPWGRWPPADVVRPHRQNQAATRGAMQAPGAPLQLLICAGAPPGRCPQAPSTGCGALRQ